MTGLEKITSRIISEAEEEAAAILSAADQKCSEIYDEYEERAKADAKKIAEQSAKECAGIIATAKSTVAINRRNAILGAKKELLDAVFETAEGQILLLPDGEYFDILITVLLKALEEGAALSGGAAPTILLNKSDKERFGGDIIERALSRVTEGRLAPSVFGRLDVSAECIDIKGGLVLRYDDFDIDCSLETMMGELRPEIEGRVASLLFKDGDKK